MSGSGDLPTKKNRHFPHAIPLSGIRINILPYAARSGKVLREIDTEGMMICRPS